jgi:hypothetical protein
VANGLHGRTAVRPVMADEWPVLAGTAVDAIVPDDLDWSTAAGTRIGEKCDEAIVSEFRAERNV